jgi:hydroxysqualene synthase
MSVRIFGAPEAEGFGLALGHTFQLTNILRDVDEDALRERVYIPRDLLDAAGIPDGPAASIVAHPNFAAICAKLGARAAAGFATAERDIRAYDPQALLPAAVMMWGYKRLMDRLVLRGWNGPRPRPKLTKGEKLRMGWMALGFGRTQ